jgi:NAD(P)-dependent dehydrogenase (short-subunit alcohol dehydrogenase family)
MIKRGQTKLTKPFHEKVAIVTGGGSGIGRATAHRLAMEGAQVVLADMNLGAAKKEDRMNNQTSNPASLPRRPCCFRATNCS